MGDGGGTKLDGRRKREGDIIPGQDAQDAPAAGPKEPVDSFISLPDVLPTELTQNKARRYRRVLGSRGLSRTKRQSRALSVRDRRLLRSGDFIARRFAVKQSARPDRLIPTWRKVKALLKHLQDSPRSGPRKGSKHSEVLIPEETVALLTGVSDNSFKENIYFSSIRNGCWVRILPPSEGDGLSRKAILSGSEDAKELVKESIARAHMLQISGDPLIEMAKPPVPVLSSKLAMHEKKLPVPLIRGVWSRSMKRPQSLDQVLSFRQDITSVKAFLEHIEDLTRVDRKSHRKTPGPPSVPYQQLVGQELWALFQGDHNRKFFSTVALNCTLEYLCKHEMFTSVREVFNSAEQFATVDSYNILLDSAARRMDRRSFYVFLNSMRRKRVQPNPSTWIALLKGMATPASKASLIQYMAQKGLLDDPGSIQSVLRLTIDDSLRLHLESGQGVESFVDMMAKTHGANWFNSTLLAQMFRVIARMKDYDALEQLLKVCNDLRFPIEGSSLTPIMTMFRGNIFNAIHHAIRLLKRPMFKFDRENYETIFLLAYKSRRYNVCRVLWYFACTENKVTYKMRQAVLTSLTRNVSIKSTDDIQKIWLTSAGNVISGMELVGLRHFPADIIKNLPVEFKEEPLLYLARGYQPKGPSRDLQLRLANLVIAQDVQLGPRFRIDFPLGIMLEAAATMDREWAGKPWPLTWLKQNAIEVPMKLCDLV
jgi:hypothetical protein